MSDNLEQDEVAKRRPRRPSTIDELFETDTSVKERADVVLRKVVNSQGFERTVTCRRGSITVLPRNQKNSYESFRQALLGRDENKQVQMRLGQHQLHPSEIYVVISSNVLNPGQTVEQSFKTAGVAPKDIAEIASIISLESHLNDKTETLPAKVVARLAAALAVWSKARVIYLDAPFQQIGSEWAPTIAHLLLESVVDSDRVMIVGGVDKLPRIWKSSPLVEVAGVDVGVYDGDIQVVDETMGYLRKIQHLIGSSAVEEGDLITTYPQRIFRRRTPSDSAMCIEAITNPNLSESEMDLYKVTPKVETNERRTPRKRQATGKLTRVTRLEKIRNKSMVIALRALMVRSQTRIDESPGLANFRIRRAEEQQQRRQQLELMLFILILLMAALLLLNWV